MTIKKKTIKKPKKEDDEGMNLDDAFGDDEDVEYAEVKPKKQVVKEKKVEKEIIDDEKKSIKASKPISKIKKGDKIKIDGKNYEVDAHYVLIDHGTTKEMAIELVLGDDDFQIRYFDDQVERTLEFYELDEIIYNKKSFSKIEW